MADEKNQGSNSKKMPVPYKYGEKIDPTSEEKSYLFCPECSEICHCPSQEDTYFICSNGHTWSWKVRNGERFIVKGEG